MEYFSARGLDGQRDIKFLQKNLRIFNAIGIIVDSNLELVKYILTGLSGKKMRSLSDSFTTSFTYSAPRVKNLTFEEFCQHVDLWAAYIDIEINKIELKDNKYIVDFMLVSVDITQNYYDNSPAIITFVMKDDLIQSIELIYKVTQKGMAYSNNVDPLEGNKKAIIYKFD